MTALAEPDYDPDSLHSVLFVIQTLLMHTTAKCVYLFHGNNLSLKMSSVVGGVKIV